MMGKAYFVAITNENKKMFLEYVRDKKKVSDFCPVGDISLNQQDNHRGKVAELTYYVNAITSKMHGREEWREFRDKLKNFALKYDPHLEDFFDYSFPKETDL